MHGGIINAITKAVHSVTQLVKLLPVGRMEGADQFGMHAPTSPSGAPLGADPTVAIDDYDEHLLKPVVSSTVMQDCMDASGGKLGVFLSTVGEVVEGSMGDMITNSVAKVLACMMRASASVNMGGIRQSNTKTLMAEVDNCGPDCPLHEINWCNICCDQVRAGMGAPRSRPTGASVHPPPLFFYYYYCY